jgi:uncharacterized protein YaaW (UPF0174 family)
MPNNDRLLSLLAELNDQELEQIWVSALRCSLEKEAYSQGDRTHRIASISKEWRALHGHTLVNLTRSEHELPWKRILIDVADKLNPGFGWTQYRLDDAHSEADIEADILRMHDERARQAWDKLSPAKKEEMANALDQEMNAAAVGLSKAGARATGSVNVASLGQGISAGLITGAGALTLAQGSGAALVGGLLGGPLYQLGLWVVVRVFGVWSGVQLVGSGTAAAVGGALVSAPAAVAFAANALMSTSYRKTIPATVSLLVAHELRRQVNLALEK